MYTLKRTRFNITSNYISHRAEYLYLKLIGSLPKSTYPYNMKSMITPGILVGDEYAGMSNNLSIVMQQAAGTM